MNEKDFFELELRAQIVPQQARWPAPEYLHWQKLHAVPDEARGRVSKAFELMDEIDRNADLSPEGKDRQRRQVAAHAIADFEASKTLARAREAVELVVARHDAEHGITPDTDEARNVAMKAKHEAEQGWRRAIDKIAERAGLSKRPDRPR